MEDLGLAGRKLTFLMDLQQRRGQDCAALFLAVCQEDIKKLLSMEDLGLDFSSIDKWQDQDQTA